MHLIYRREYERYARSHGLTVCGRRKARRAIRQADRLIRRRLKPFYGRKLTPAVVSAVKLAICAAVRPKPFAPMVIRHDIATNRIEIDVAGWGKA